MENWPNLGFSHLVIHNVDLDKWCDRYDLETYTGFCVDCNRDMNVCIPFVGHDGIRGLRAEVCICGNMNTPFIMTSPTLNELL